MKPPPLAKLSDDKALPPEELCIITEDDLLRYRSVKPWERFWARRPVVSHTFDYAALTPDAQAWVDQVLHF